MEIQKEESISISSNTDMTFGMNRETLTLYVALQVICCALKYTREFVFCKSNVRRFLLIARPSPTNSANVYEDYSPSTILNVFYVLIQVLEVWVQSDLIYDFCFTKPVDFILKILLSVCVSACITFCCTNISNLLVSVFLLFTKRQMYV